MGINEACEHPNTVGALSHTFQQKLLSEFPEYKRGSDWSATGSKKNAQGIMHGKNWLIYLIKTYTM